MNREIIFRGKSDRGEWIEGYFCPCCFGRFPCEPAIIGKDEMDEGCWRPVRVDPATVGQYTGSTDKNGTKIFEGDIVKAECDLYHGENKKERVTRIGTVIYDKKFCQFGINVAGFSKCYVLSRWKGDYNEVIGNIHDNPELLKGEQA